MKRLRRWLFNLAAVVSVCLSIGLITLWVRSQQKGESFSIRMSSGESYALVTAKDVVGLKSVRFPANSGSVATGMQFIHSVHGRLAGLSQLQWSFGGFGYQFNRGADLQKSLRDAEQQAIRRAATRSSAEEAATVRSQGIMQMAVISQRGITHWLFTFPTWASLAISMALPIARGVQILSRQSKSHDIVCANCGYDLRATPERCPECGTKTAAHG